jgi:hypothetical protein
VVKARSLRVKRRKATALSEFDTQDSVSVAFISGFLGRLLYVRLARVEEVDHGLAVVQVLRTVS